MNSLPRRLALFVFVLMAGSLSLSAAENEKLVADTIEKARSYLGGETALAKISSLRMEGVLVFGNGQSGTVEIIYKRPSFQRIVSTIGGMQETSVLNKSEAWRLVRQVDQPESANLNLYSVEEIYRMQAAVRDMFDFYETPKVRKGAIRFVREDEVEGSSVVVLRYDHGMGIWFEHFFDQKTGRPVKTVNDSGMEFVRYGEQTIDGIRFPEKLITRSGNQVLEVTYSTIELNVDLPEDFFRMPM